MAETKAAYTHVGPGLPPLYGARAKALILGSFPSPKSREQGFFYGHPQNRFWPLMASLTGEPVPDWQDIEAKKGCHPEARPGGVGYHRCLRHPRRVRCLHPQCGTERRCRPHPQTGGCRRCSATARLRGVSMQNMPRQARVCPLWCCPAPAPPTRRGRWTVCAPPGAGNCCLFCRKTVANVPILFYNKDISLQF